MNTTVAPSPSLDPIVYFGIPMIILIVGGTVVLTGLGVAALVLRCVASPPEQTERDSDNAA